MKTDLSDLLCSGLVGLLAAWSADLLLGGERPHRGAGRAGAAAQPRRLQVSRVTRGVYEVSRSFDSAVPETGMGWQALAIGYGRFLKPFLLNAFLCSIVS